MIWLDDDPDGVLCECATCGHIVLTGTFNDDPAHTNVSIIREGQAA